MMKILITGGAGFIGSHLVKTLLDQGHIVTVVDSLYTGQRSNLSFADCNSNFSFKAGDIVDTIWGGSFDQIYNLACPASPIHYQADPIHTFKTSVIGVINLLELATQTGARLLQASTSEVYGDPTIHPQPETYFGNVNPIGIRACYDEGKRSAETLCCDYARTRNTQVRLARIFNTYGPNMRPDDGRVVSNFIVQAIQNKSLTMYGDGTQTRSFCYVSDLVDGLVRLMNSDLQAIPVNLGNPGEFTMIELANHVLDLTGSSSQIEYRPLPLDDPKLRQPVIDLADRALGWSPTVPLRDGLVSTIDYFRRVVNP